MISIVLAQKIVDELSSYFGVENPTVRFAKSNSRRCWYWIFPNEIALARNHADNNCVLHEFSHALVRKKNGDAKGHGDLFAISLIEVVDFYYKGNLKKYPWRWEYNSIKKFYESYTKLKQDSQ